MGGAGQVWYLTVWLGVDLVRVVRSKRSLEGGEGTSKWNLGESVPNRRNSRAKVLRQDHVCFI